LALAFRAGDAFQGLKRMRLFQLLKRLTGDPKGTASPKEPQLPGPDKTQRYWGDHVGDHLQSFLQWETNPPSQLHQNFRVSGDRNVVAAVWFWKKYGPFSSVASIGSGTGILERWLCGLPDFEGNVVGFDISPRSVEVASANCAQFPNVKFELADLNVREWEADQFDVVFAHGALHHIESLDWCVGQRGLRNGGLLYVNDFVGPQRYQYSDAQMRIANELLERVPPRWRKRTSVVRCDAEQLKKDDPSEAACSHFIEQTVRVHFEVLERKPRGGTLLGPDLRIGLP
jgi:2-polyprenyl-3-methyl-5-hydroxy-6-metoxy-1,4-benzoquinol methylase